MEVLDEEGVTQLLGDMSTMQQVLDEAAGLLKLVWRVSLPTGGAATTANEHQVCQRVMPPDHTMPTLLMS